MKKQEKKAAADCLEWDKKIPVGTAVSYRPCLSSDNEITTKTRSGAWVVCGQAVCLVEGRGGGVSLKHLRVMAEAL
jgi:hypothetical protein